MYIRKIEKRLILLVYLITSTIILFFINEACYTKVQASSLFMGKGQTKVVMVTIDYLGIEDISEDNYLRELFDKSCSALVSSRQNGKASATKVKLSIGAGKRLSLNNNTIKAVGYANQQLEGSPGNVIAENIKELKKTNEESGYLSYIGYLGNKLNEIDKTTCILGNSDTDVYNRNNILIPMDSKGIVDYGDVESATLYDKSFPGGKRTNFKKLLELYNAYLPDSDFMVIDTGDLARLEYYKSKLTADKYELYRKQATNRISEFARAIVEKDNYNITFLLVSAYPSSDNIKNGDRLTPVLAYTREGPGLLYSGSTRREGIITSLDIADYIIEKLDFQQKSQLLEIRAEEPLEKLLLLKSRILNISNMRLPVLTWYAVFEIICAVFGLLYVLNIKLMKRAGLLGFIKTTILVNISAPAILLYMSAMDIAQPPLFFVVFISISYGIAYIISRCLKDANSRFTAAALLVNLSLTVDLMRNSFFIKSSVFGYDPIIGARFYGIGNEYAGVYLGSSILMAGCLLQLFSGYIKRKPIPAKLLLLLFFVLQVYIIGTPNKGANFGATIAIVCGIFFFFCAVTGKRVKVKQLILLVLLIITVISSVVFIDLKDISNMSHIGRFITDIKENGIRILLATFIRKLEMNLRLIKYTIWTKVLLCIILIITIMFFKPVRLLRSIFIKYRYIAAAWLGISAGSIAGLIVNDSGIVMAATAMIFTGYTILYICIEELETGRAGGENGIQKSGEHRNKGFKAMLRKLDNRTVASKLANK